MYPNNQFESLTAKKLIGGTFLLKWFAICDVQLIREVPLPRLEVAQFRFAFLSVHLAEFHFLFDFASPLQISNSPRIIPVLLV